MRKIALILAGIYMLSSVVYGQAPGFIKKVQAVRLHEPVQIDGILSEAAWQRPGTTAFFQMEPNQGRPVSERTEIWVAYDDDALYIAAHLYDDHPDSIIARLSRRDNDIGGDQFAVGIDSYHDKRNGRYFFISAAGTLFDGILYNDDWSDATWDGVWEAKQQMTPDGWTVEMRIPFSQLRFEEKDSYIWGINIERIIGRKKEQAYLVYTPRNESGFVSRFPELVGIEHITPPVRFEATPYLTGRGAYINHEDGNPFTLVPKYTPDIGGDFRLGLGSNLTLDGTINPDFGQVEVDPAVVNLSDVETYYNEKRPFFVEGTNIFLFGQGGVNNFWSFNWSTPNLFYTRRIGRAPQRDFSELSSYYSDIPSTTHILGAAKLTGKLFDGWNIGVIQSFTQREYGQVDTGNTQWNTEVEPASSYTVVRLQRDFNDGKQGVGSLTTYAERFFSDAILRADVNDNALVQGIDGWTALDHDKEYMVSGWTAYSRVSGSTDRMISLQSSSSHYFQRPDAGYVSIDSTATSLEGYAGRINLNKQKGRFMVNAAFGFISPGYDSGDLGFVWHTDAINSHVAVGYRWNDPTPYYRYFNVYASVFETFDFGRIATWRGIWGEVDYQTTGYHAFSLSYDYGFPSMNIYRSRGGPAMRNPDCYEWNANYSSDSRNDYVFAASWYGYEGGDAFNHQLSLSVTMRPVSNLSISIGPAFTLSRDFGKWVDNVSDPSATATYGMRYLFADMVYHELSAQFRIDWTLTPTMSLQAFIQPLIASANYSNFKSLAKPGSFDFNIFGTDGSIIRDSLASGGTRYVIMDPDGNGPASAIVEQDPTFNSISLRGNLIFRWEYLPGSALFLVWTQNRYGSLGDGNFNFTSSMDQYAGSRSDNVFMLKLSYWIGS